MRIRIRTKLFAGFMLLIFLMFALTMYLVSLSQKSLQQSIGRSSLLLAEEMLKRIGHDIYHKIEEIQILSNKLSLQESFSESNSKFENLNNIKEYINQRDKEWGSLPEGEISPLMQDLISNELSTGLRKEIVEFYKKKYGYEVFSEIFSTNKYGANIAQTGRTSDYRQDDEEWWQIAKEKGFYVGDVEYDESAKAYGVSIGVRVRNAQGNFIGVIKAFLDMKGIIKEAEFGIRKYKTTETRLITKDGRLIYASNVFRFLEDISGKKFFKKISSDNNVFITEENRIRKLFSYAHSKSHRNFEGLGWILLIAHDVDDILKPVFILRNRMTVVSLIFLAMLIIITSLLSRSVTRPIMKLTRSSRIIGEGDIGHRVNLKTNDEVGELAEAFDQMAERRQEVEEALRTSEKKYHSLIETSPDLIFILERKTAKIIDINESVCKSLGYSKDEIVGTISGDRVVPAQKDSYRLELENLIKNERFSGEYDIRKKDGSILTIEARGAAFGDYAFAIGRDITERMKIEEALRESEERWHSVVKNAPDIIITVDNEGKIIFINHTPEGISVEETLGTNVMDYVTPEHREIVKQAIQKVFETGDNEYYEISARGPYDKTAWYATHLGSIMKKGKVVAGMLITRDITKRKEAEEALLRSEERYRHITDSITDYIYTVRLEGGKQVETIHGENCFAVTGYTSEELSADTELWIQMLVEEDRYIVLQQLDDALTGRYPQPVEHRIIRKDGVVIWVESTIVPYYGANGNLVSYDGLMRDITKRKRIEEQLLHAQKMESIGTLAGGVAHDFNNILTAIIGYADSLKRKLPEGNALKFYAEQIETAGESAAVLTKDLLTFSRKQRTNLMPLSSNVLIWKLEKMLLRIIGEDIEFRTVLSESDLHLMMDFNQMQQVLMNLVSNARDAMPKGGLLTISTETFEIDSAFLNSHGFGEPGSYALVSISDTGMGMDETTKEKIFEPFFTSKEVGKGTGLGLSIVYGIIKQHKGYIDVNSKPGEGTTFKIYLPVMTEAVEDMGVNQHKASAPTGGTETILVAEDNKMVMTLITSILTESGYKVITAEDGEKALTKFMEHKDSIQFIISDVIMPKKSGSEVYEEINKIRPDIKCLFLSGYSPERMHQNGIIEKGAHFMSKPIKPDDLLRKVREILDNNLS